MTTTERAVPGEQPPVPEPPVTPGRPSAHGTGPPPQARPRGLLRPYLGGFAGLIVLQVIGAVAGLVPLLAVAELGRVLLAPGPVDPGHVRWIVLAGVVGLLVRLLFTSASSTVGHILDDRIQLSLRRELAAHLGRMPIGRLARRRTGELAKAVGEDVSAVHPFVAHTPGELVSAFVVPAVALVYLFTVDWRLTLVTLVPVFLALAHVPLLMTPTRRREEEEYNTAMGRISNSVVEFVQGITVVKAFGGGERAHHRFVSATDAFTRVFQRMVHGLAPIGAGMQLAVSPPFVMLTVLVGGTVLITTGGLVPADLLPFLLLGVGLTAPVAALSHGFDDLVAARSAVGRIRDVLAEPPLPEPAHPLPPRGHRVELRGVRFGYEPDHEVLRGVDLVLEPGTVTAVVGPSGSGKSTLVRLLPRFFDPTHGSITLGGVDLRRTTGHDLYRKVSFVFQETRPLRASVAENIALAVPATGSAAASDAVVRAARAVGLHDRILELPRGYDTVLGDEAALSGGEAQRLSIARALMADTPVLVLDEATAFADPLTEQALRRALAELRGDRTILLIAHRWETVADADTAVMLQDGAVVEHGPPADLLTRDGAFAAFWRPRVTDGTRDDASAPEGDELR
ncbi:ABC transporter ATP-binding protein [Nocardiopsis ganjiahuensis]|uniref:ABC transporter ATP-binding protein n=1 Tax=Nocardiopsis ganjiahuensis TaxID=239984 RepID=UPI00034BE263|nr:ABC transporter ATP-binding protein [Nocardiopsis ganjiahuensis]